MATKKSSARRSGGTGTKKKTSRSTGGTKKKTSRKKSSSRRSDGGGGGDAGFASANMVRVETEIAGRKLVLETGRMAKQADGAVVARYGDTVCLATAQGAKGRDDAPFFPLTVDYREKFAAAGKFPGGFFKREGRPTTREILGCRIIDRSIRPFFPDGYRDEVQVLSQVLSSDGSNEADVLAAIASFAAVAISSLPMNKVLGMCRIGLIDDELIVNPAWAEMNSEENLLNLTVTAHADGICMVEGGAKQVSEDIVLEALELAKETNDKICELIEDLVDQAGREKAEFTPPARDESLDKAIRRKFEKDLHDANFVEGDKHARSKALGAIVDEVVEAFPFEGDPADEKAARAHASYVKETARSVAKEGHRAGILEGTRSDGRAWDEVRAIDIEASVLPMVHGSSLFTRGETQALCIATLGSPDDQQIIDGLYTEPRKRFLLHYAFPPFSVGEVKRFLAPGRREIGHGALAERAIEPLLPKQEDFPYSLRLTSEILESNGSSSMATVCGGCLALMDAGVPIKQPVAGIAMGLVVEGKKTAILSDILGSEDAIGDMDFKVAGTGEGITALQMDIKCEGLSRELMEEAMEQAREGRLHILREMLSVLRAPREKLSPNAPRLVSIRVPTEKIGSIIGPAGRVIRGMQDEFEVKISIEDDGLVTVSGRDGAKVDACLQHIGDMTADVELGATYTGKVTSIREFGAFVEILPGQEGLVHVSELDNGFVRAVTDVVKVGDEIEVKVIDIDDFGKVKLSRKALLPPAEGDEDGGDRPRGRRDRDDDERPRGRGRRDRDDDDRPRGRGRRERDDDDRPRGRGRDDNEERPRGRSRRYDDDDRPRGRGRRDRDDDDRPRGRGRRDRDDDDRPRGRGRRDDEDRPRGRDDDDRPRGRGRDDEDRPRGRGRDDDDRPRGRGRRDDGEEPPRGRGGRDRDDEDRPRGRGRPEGDDDEAPRRGRDRRQAELDFDEEPQIEIFEEDVEVGGEAAEVDAGGDDDADAGVRRRRGRGRRGRSGGGGGGGGGRRR